MKTLFIILTFLFITKNLFGQVTQEWTARYDDVYDDDACVVKIDKSGNVYVFGSSALSGVVFDFNTVKYDSLGNKLWSRRYNGASNDQDYGICMELDRDGDIYVAGRSIRNSGTLS